MRPYLIFISAAIGLLMYSIDTTVVAVAFPNFIRDLHTNVLWAAWTISIYLVAVTSTMPLMGKLSDSFGRKKIFLLSLILFIGSSAACGLAPNIYVLVVFRFIQGVGGASFLPTATGLVSDQFPRHRERAIGLITSMFPLGSIVGPNLGGWIVSRYSWRYLFYINLPIGIGVMILIMILLEDSETVSNRTIDFRGALFFFAAILFFMFGLNLIAENFSAVSLVVTPFLLALSVCFLWLFFRHEKRHPNPILDMALLKSRPFLAANLYNIMGGAGVFAIFSFIPLYATSVHKLSTLASGMILTPRSIGVIFMSTLTSFLLRRWGYRQPMIVGMIVLSFSTILFCGLGFQLLGLVGIGTTWALIILIMFTGIGNGMVLPSSNNACIELMPEKVATISGLRGTFRAVGGAFGISVITIILHLSSSPESGFRTTFIAFGLLLLLTIPLTFMMPSGKGGIVINKSAE